MRDNLQAGIPNKEPEDFARAKFYCPYALANREKMLEFSSAVLPAPSLYHQKQNL